MRNEGATRSPPEKTIGRKSVRPDGGARGLLRRRPTAGKRSFRLQPSSYLLCEIREATAYHEPGELSEAQRLLKSGLRFSLNAAIPSSSSADTNTRPIASRSMAAATSNGAP